MAKEQDYRRLADQCLMLANKCGGRQARIILVYMAQEWMRLADKERSQQRLQIEPKVKSMR